MKVHLSAPFLLTKPDKKRKYTALQGISVCKGILGALDFQVVKKEVFKRRKK